MLNTELSLIGIYEHVAMTKWKDLRVCSKCIHLFNQNIQKHTSSVIFLSIFYCKHNLKSLVYLIPQERLEQGLKR